MEAKKCRPPHRCEMFGVKILEGTAPNILGSGTSPPFSRGGGVPPTPRICIAVDTVLYSACIVQTVLPEIYLIAHLHGFPACTENGMWIADSLLCFCVY